jgi:hypothetical protein
MTAVNRVISRLCDVLVNDIGLAQARLGTHVAAGVIRDLDGNGPALQLFPIVDEFAGQRVAVVAEVFSREKKTWGGCWVRRRGRSWGRTWRRR